MIGFTDHSGQPASYANVCEMVISEVTATIEVPLEEFDQTLYEAIDPDALEALFGNHNNCTDQIHGHIEFHFAGCKVMVQESGDVSASLLEEASTSDTETIATRVDQDEPE